MLSSREKSGGGDRPPLYTQALMSAISLSFSLILLNWLSARLAHKWAFHFLLLASLSLSIGYKLLSLLQYIIHWQMLGGRLGVYDIDNWTNLTTIDEFKDDWPADILVATVD